MTTTEHDTQPLLSLSSGAEDKVARLLAAEREENLGLRVAGSVSITRTPRGVAGAGSHSVEGTTDTISRMSSIGR